jgi:2-polyprenyl-3-methyl-5-hydroxy-6-metoxy-1,4-benzoquinol methylase
MTEFTGEFFLPGQTKKRLLADHQGRYQFARKFIEGKRVLDMACGSGYGSFMLASSGAIRVDGVDISEAAIGYARTNFKRENLTYIASDLLAFAPAEKYNVVVSFETIEHIENYREVIKKYQELLEPGGVLLLSTPNRLITSPKAKTLADAPSNVYHVREFIAQELVAELVAAGFIVDRRNIYGQRLQPYFRSQKLLKVYKKIFQPHKFSNAYPKRFSKMAPRYLLIQAIKE